MLILGSQRVMLSENCVMHARTARQEESSERLHADTELQRAARGQTLSSPPGFRRLSLAMIHVWYICFYVLLIPISTLHLDTYEIPCTYMDAMGLGDLGHETVIINHHSTQKGGPGSSCTIGKNHPFFVDR